MKQSAGTIYLSHSSGTLSPTPAPHLLFGCCCWHLLTYLFIFIRYRYHHSAALDFFFALNGRAQETAGQRGDPVGAGGDAVVSRDRGMGGTGPSSSDLSGRGVPGLSLSHSRDQRRRRRIGSWPPVPSLMESPPKTNQSVLLQSPFFLLLPPPLKPRHSLWRGNQSPPPLSLEPCEEYPFPPFHIYR